MSVTKITEHHDREMRDTLLDLLHRLDHGRLRGLMVAVKTGPKRHRIGVSGEYWLDPYDALSCVTRMEYKINQLISSRDEDPETGHAPL